MTVLRPTSILGMLFTVRAQHSASSQEGLYRVLEYCAVFLGRKNNTPPQNRMYLSCTVLGPRTSRSRCLRFYAARDKHPGLTLRSAEISCQLQW